MTYKRRASEPQVGKLLPPDCGGKKLTNLRDVVAVLAWKLGKIDDMCVVCNGDRSTEFLSGRVR